MAPPAHRIRARPPIVGAALAAVVVLAGGAASGCSDEPERTEAAYCDAVRTNLTSLVGPSLATGDDVTALLDTYGSIAAVAPAAIGPEWERLLEVLQTVSTVVPSDPASLSAANQAALAGQPAYTRIQQYTQVTCEVAIGSPPMPTNPVTATTIPPPSTAPPSTAPPSTGTDGG